MTLEEKIYSFEEDNTIIGIGNAEPFHEIRDRLLAIETPFVTKDINRRITPKLIRETCQSIICIAMSYNKKFIGKMDDEVRGKMSIGAIGIDYHKLIFDKLRNIKTELNLEGDIFVDTGDLVDREVAKRCGIGNIGKSGNIITEKLGSLVYIGYILVDIKLEYSKIIDKDFCQNCDKCIKACPTNSIKKDIFEYSSCISYLTQKRELSQNERNLINLQIYGCDICQNVCPYNKNVFCEYSNVIDDFYPKIADILNMSNSTFSKTYKKQSCGWRGKKLLQRNAIITLGNGSYDISKIEMLKKLFQDTREDIREVAGWSIEQLEDKRKHNGIF